MNILLADDHRLIRDGIRLILKQLSDDVNVYEADSYQGVIDSIRKPLELDLLLIDLNMPGMSFCRSIKVIKNSVPEIPIVILSSTEDADVVRDTLAVGASGYITKSMSAEVMLSALQLILSGGVYIPSMMLPRPQSSAQMCSTVALNNVCSQTLHEAPKLTKRQKDVLNLVCVGNSDKEIGNKLNISETTVRTHTAAIYKILNVHNRTQASHLAVEFGILE